MFMWDFGEHDDRKKVVFCEFNMQVTYHPGPDNYKVAGSLATVWRESGRTTINSVDYDFIEYEQAQSNRPVVINLKLWRSTGGGTIAYTGRTDGQGRFEIQIPGTDLRIGPYRVIPAGQCLKAGYQEIMKTDYWTLHRLPPNPTPTLDGPAGECAGDNCKNIRLENYSGTTDTFTLVGPVTYTFPFGYGVSTHSILYGEYEFSYTSCDGKWTSTGHLYANEVWDFAGPPSCDD